MCLFLLPFSLIDILKNKTIVSILFVSRIIFPIIGFNWYFNIYTLNPELYFLPMSFSIDCLFALWKEKISVNIYFVLGMILLCCLVKDTNIYHPMFYLVIFLYISDKSKFSMLSIKTDISDGVYIYGFLIQQLVSLFFLKRDLYLI